MSDLYAENFNYKIVNDPIYGCINLSKIEVQLLDTKAMQRLRRIRQMGFASYVFPSGEHTRFVHSLGVLCIMGKMCEHLYRLYGEENEDGIHFTIDDIRKLRIAALLHDVGHFPFSHLTECVYSYIESVRTSGQMVEGFGAVNDKELLCEIANDKKKDAQDHEHMGQYVVKEDPEIVAILESAHVDPEEIGQMIIGDTQAKPVYAQLLHSSLDADRLDYLLRDSRQAGVSFGNVELEYILRQLRIKRCPIHQEGGTTEIELVVFDDRGQHAIEHFLMARYFHYTQVIQHKTSSAFEAVAKTLVYKVLTSVETPYQSFDDIVGTIGKPEFYQYTDDYMWETMRNFCDKSEDSYVGALWKCISQRKKPIHVLRLTDIIPKDAAGHPVNDSVYLLTKWLIRNMREDLAQEAGINSAYIGFVESKLRIESIPSHLKAEDCSLEQFQDEVRGAIRIVDREKKVTFLASNNKSLINKMVDFTSNILDVFVIGDIGDENVEKLKKAILSRAKDV